MPTEQNYYIECGRATTVGNSDALGRQRRSVLTFAQESRQNRMDVNQINAYLERAREITGDRSRAEIDYDNAVVANLRAGMDIKRSIAAANQKYPTEALRPGPEDWADPDGYRIVLQQAEWSNVEKL